MGLKSGERKADKIGSEEKASKGEEEAEACGVGVEELGVTAAEEMAEVLKVEERWSGDLDMAGEAMGGGGGGAICRWVCSVCSLLLDPDPRSVLQALILVL